MGVPDLGKLLDGMRKSDAALPHTRHPFYCIPMHMVDGIAYGDFITPSGLLVQQVGFTFDNQDFYLEKDARVFGFQERAHAAGLLHIELTRTDIETKYGTLLHAYGRSPVLPLTISTTEQGEQKLHSLFAVGSRPLLQEIRGTAVENFLASLEQPEAYELIRQASGRDFPGSRYLHRIKSH